MTTSRITRRQFSNGLAASAAAAGLVPGLARAQSYPSRPVRFVLPDTLHTFRPGHRVMVQVQSTWFPLVDRNPQTFCDIYSAKAEDFKKALHRVHRSGPLASRVVLGVLP